ncbi:MAG TPA: IPT/TIG domain-containing protein [Bryobacteraceae bacterium]|nr:IPT/TIG domain-containing protein [Bryobacteraceae bacterium]
MIRILFAFLWPAIVLSGQPRIFFTDLESGPKTGGENNQGAFVTIHGSGFGDGDERARVTIGGGVAASYRIWTASKIVIQLGAAAATGDILVTTAAGTSNPAPFTVRGGNIYFVARNGKDSNRGTFTSPWRTILKAKNSIKAGDIAYVEDGVNQTSDDGEGWSSCLTIGGTGGAPGLPAALVAYPGATAIIGATGACPSAIRTKGYGESHWVLAGFVLRGGGAGLAIAQGDDWRVIANDISCPDGDGASGCVETSQSSNWKFLGNRIHDAGKPNASALYHGVYFSTDSNHLDVGWNIIENVHGCRGLQIHSSPLQGGGASDPTGRNQFDLKIHDNIIHDTQCDGIVLATVDPSRGAIEIYNNLIYNAGKGPDNPEHSGSWSCICLPGWGDASAKGAIDVHDNTLYNCGGFANPPYRNARAAVLNGGGNPNLAIRLRNNIIVSRGGVPYVIAYEASGRMCADRGDCKGVTGARNLFFGNGGAPAIPGLTQSISRDPLFIDPAKGDFHLRPNSPARDLGAFPLADHIEGSRSH